jgi:trans-feruloyl-CoA hydratase/vanillin synthase
MTSSVASASAKTASMPSDREGPVKVEFEDGIAWVILNRPEKRNCMNPALNRRMVELLDELEIDPRAKILVLTGAGDAFTAGMDLKEFFREAEKESTPERLIQIRRDFTQWAWRRLQGYTKPTIAMVNGWCFGGGITPLVSCDLAIAAEDAKFGISEINWGIIPGGNVTRAIAATMNRRDALYYIMTGLPFDGRKAQEMGLVNEAVPADQLRARTKELARILMEKNPSVLRNAKQAFINGGNLPWDVAEDYLSAKNFMSMAQDPERGREQGLKQFLDEKSIRPGLQSYKRPV